jgi:hypothetical protein
MTEPYVPQPDTIAAGYRQNGRPMPVVQLAIISGGLGSSAVAR